MRAKLTQRRAVRVGLIASLLIAATLVLSGCWANVYNFGDGDRSITITQAMSDSIIWNCTVEKGTGEPRAFCALDTVRELCNAFPVKGVSEVDCPLLGNYGDWQDMNQAILDVIGPTYDCLSFLEHADSSTGDFWYAIQKGYRACK
jgi:hypothetical protein